MHGGTPGKGIKQRVREITTVIMFQELDLLVWILKCTLTCESKVSIRIYTAVSGV